MPVSLCLKDVLQISLSLVTSMTGKWHRKRYAGVRQLYRTLSEASNDLIFVVGRNDRVEYVNSYAAAMVNKPIQEIIGSPRETLFPPDVVINQKKALDAVFERGISVRSSSPLTFNGRIVLV